MRAKRQTTAIAHKMFAASITAMVLTIPVMLAGSAAAQQGGAQQQPLRAISVGFVRHAFGAWMARIADGGFTNATGRSLRWMPHDTDSAVASAHAAGKLDIALMGAGVAVSAVARGIDLKIVYVLGHSADSEGLVVAHREGRSITDTRALQGLVIATPFGSTPHFRLLQSIKEWNLSLGSMRLVNLQSGQIADAWRRGEIDAAMVSEPLLGALGQRGSPIALPQIPGHPGMIVLVAGGEFVASHVVFLSRFIDVIARSQAKPPERQPAERSGPDAEPGSDVKSIAFITGLQAAEVARGIDRYQPQPLVEQASPAWLGGGGSSPLAAELQSLAEVWRWSGRLTGREPDFAAMLAPEAVRMALTYR